MAGNQKLTLPASAEGQSPTDKSVLVDIVDI